MMSICVVTGKVTLGHLGEVLSAGSLHCKVRIFEN